MDRTALTACFEFSREWEHAGERYAPGDRIDLPEHKASRLRGLGAGQIVDMPAAAGASPLPSPSPRKRR
jgi:hypothetical protein